MSAALPAVQDESLPFFAHVAAAPRRVLFVDYDGTIAPFAVNRFRAVPYPQVTELLARIMMSCDTRVIVIGGRAAREIHLLLGIAPAPEIWGTHGIERITNHGTCSEIQVTDEALLALEKAERLLDAEGLGDRMEVKRAAVAVHWRGLPVLAGIAIRSRASRILEPLTASQDLVLADFDEGMEIRLASASKGFAVRDFVSNIAADTAIAYLGDDITDEDAFRVLRGRGLPVLVTPRFRPTAAEIWVQPPDGVVAFLTRWIAACRNSSEGRLQ